MSVAFRRESDEEHLEPKFEIPTPPGRNLVTARGLAMIGARLAEVEAHLPALTDEEERKKAHRDLRYWRARQATAEPMPVPSPGKAVFGSAVTYELDGKERTIRIVGHDEADPADGLVSFLAPLSRALLGAEEGDLVDFNGRDGVIEVIAVA
jgi:transcription elongation GreA/GreB family factor